MPLEEKAPRTETVIRYSTSIGITEEAAAAAKPAELPGLLVKEINNALAMIFSVSGESGNAIESVQLVEIAPLEFNVVAEVR